MKRKAKSKMLFSIALIVSCIMIRAQEPELVLYFPFDEGKGNKTTEEISNLSTDLLNTAWEKGVSGECLVFNGIENRKAGSGGSCAIFWGYKKNQFLSDLRNKAVTIEAWIKPDKNEPKSKAMEILSCAGSDFGPGYRLTYTWDLICFLSGDGTKAKHWKVTTNPKMDQIKPGSWNYVVVTINQAGKVTMFLNGKEIATDMKTKGLLYPSNSAFCIGSYSKGRAYTFKGCIDEVKIFKGAKRPKQIQKDYNIIVNKMQKSK